VWTEKLGVDNDRVKLVTPSTGEMAVDIADAVIDSAGCSMLVIDSLAFMIPMKEAESSAEDQHMGRQARMFNELCRKTMNTMNKARMRGFCPTVIWVNQYRTNIGTMFGDNRTVPGGRAVEASANLMLSIRNKEHVEKDEYGIEQVDYNEHEFTITKNKVCNGPRTGAFRLMRADDSGTGLMEGDIDNATTMITFAKKFGLWGGAGKNQWLRYDNVDFSFGKQVDAIRMLNEDASQYWGLYYALIKRQAIARRMPDDFIARFD
jgi:recombination protein RecA